MKTLVLGGGGNKGCFEAGVLCEIFNHIKFDNLYGTSVGSLNCLFLGQAYLENNPSILECLWTKIIQSDKQVYNKNILKLLVGHPPCNFKPLQKILENNIDFKKIIKMEQEIKINTVDLKSSKTYTISNHDKNITPERLIQAAIASSSAPPLFPPVEMDGKLLVDGGIRENIPSANVFNNKNINDTILMIVCSPENMANSDENFNNIVEISLRTLDIMTDEINKNDIYLIEKINNLKKEAKKTIGDNKFKKEYINVDIIMPDYTISEKMLDFNPDILKSGFTHGRLKAKDFLNCLNIN